MRRRFGPAALALSLTLAATSPRPAIAQLVSAATPPTASRDCPDCPDLITVKPGRFVMGTGAAEAARMGAPVNRYVAWEQPQHAVVIARPFRLGRDPVTRAQYARFAAAMGDEAAGDAWRTPGIHQSDDDPAVKVSWTQAQAYVAWLAKTTSQPYRLPTEAEYEYAARAGTTTPWPWGNEVGADEAVCDGCGTDWDGKETAPVDATPANAWGLRQMVGNVFEWTQDCWHPDYQGAPTDGSAWLTGGDCVLRVTRGGSWNLDPRFVRAAARGRDATDYQGDMVGFRVARDLGTDTPR